MKNPEPKGFSRMLGRIGGTASDAERKPLSGEEASDFARQLAALARAGLPLASGLRALGDELRAGRLRSMLRDVATQIERGEPLESALSAEGPRFPAALRGLITAGVRSGRLAEALGRYLQMDDLRVSLRRGLRVALIYPCLLLLTSFSLFVFVSIITTYGFEAIFKDFGVPIPWITRVLLQASSAFAAVGWWVVYGPIVGVALVWLAMRLTLQPAERRRLVQRLPLIGPLARDTALAQFCPVLAMLIQSDVPLGEALRLAGDSSGDDAMRETARGMAEEIDSGRSLSEAVRGRRPFPIGFDGFLAWAEAHRGLVEALVLSAESFETRARARSAFVANFCKVVMMTVVISGVGLTTLALFTPMMSLLLAVAGPSPSSFDGYEALTIGGIASLSIIGVAIVIALAWPIARIGNGRAPVRPSGKLQARIGDWRSYLAAMGWILLGAAAVMISSLRFLNWIGADWLPDWWKLETWPWTEVFGIAVAWVGISIIAFAIIAARVRQPRKMDEPGSQNTKHRRLGMGMPKWRFGMRHMMFALAPIALLMVLARDFGMSLVAVGGLMVPPLAVVSLFLALRDRRSLQREALLQIMAMASRDRQPLGPAVAAFAPSCPGRFGRSVATLAARLEGGDPLPLALDRVPNVLSRSGSIVARVGWETGTLPQMLDDAVKASSRDKASRAAAIGSIAYPLAIVATIVGVGVFSISYIGPRFVAILNDFQATIPEPSRSVLKATDGLFFLGKGDNPTPALVLGALIGGAVFLVSLAVVTLGRPLLDTMPLLDRWTQRRHASVILRALAAAIEAAQTVPVVLSRLAASYPRRATRGRLRKAAARVDRGEPAFDALRVEGLISRSDATLLASAGRVGNLPWALRQTAESGDRRLAYRVVALGQIARTVSFAAMGSLVLLFSLTYFVPLIAIINLLSRSL